MNYSIFQNDDEPLLQPNLNLHEGHRERLRNKLVESNFSQQDDYVVLEYLLTLCVKRKDTNELAHQLINTFGSLAKVCDSDISLLTKVKGVTPTIATFLHSIPFICRNYQLSKCKPKQSLTCPQDIFNYLGKAIFHLPVEEFYLICLDNNNGVISKYGIAMGKSNSITIKTKELIQKALDAKAEKILLVHNHPTGDVTPSTEDIETTKRLYFNFTLNGIQLADHLIVNYQSKFFSFSQEGLLKQFDDACKHALK